MQTGTTQVWLEEGEHCIGARTIVQDVNLSFTQNGNTVEFDLGILRDYEVVILNVEER